MKKLGRVYLSALIVFLYLPIAVMIAMGFNYSPYYQLPFRFSTRWVDELLMNDDQIQAGRNSVVFAIITTVIAMVLGTMAAVALHRREFPGRALLRMLLLPPIAIPWLITGTAMLVMFYWSGIGRGFHAMLIGHVALAIPYVALVVGTGLQITDLEKRP